MEPASRNSQHLSPTMQRTADERFSQAISPLVADEERAAGANHDSILPKRIRGSETGQYSSFVPLQVLFDSIQAIQNSMIRARPASMDVQVVGYRKQPGARDERSER